MFLKGRIRVHFFGQSAAPRRATRTGKGRRGRSRVDNERLALRHRRSHPQIDKVGAVALIETDDLLLLLLLLRVSLIRVVVVVVVIRLTDKMTVVLVVECWW